MARQARRPTAGNERGGRRYCYCYCGGAVVRGPLRRVVRGLGMHRQHVVQPGPLVSLGVLCASSVLRPHHAMRLRRSRGAPRMMVMKELVYGTLVMPPPLVPTIVLSIFRGQDAKGRSHRCEELGARFHGRSRSQLLARAFSTRRYLHMRNCANTLRETRYRRQHDAKKIGHQGHREATLTFDKK